MFEVVVFVMNKNVLIKKITHLAQQDQDAMPSFSVSFDPGIIKFL